MCARPPSNRRATIRLYVIGLFNWLIFANCPPIMHSFISRLASRLGVAFLHSFDPETAHRLALFALSRGWVPRDPDPPDPALRQMLWGREFAHPIGLAAGFDKDARALPGLIRAGFGFLEIGTVTRHPQPGNPRPRLFRLAEDRALINRLGFPSEGAARVLARLAAAPRPPIPLGVNIGPNKETADAAADLAELARTFAPHADYLTLNVSSPNTPGLREMQQPERLARLLRAIRAALPAHVPLLVKIAPDLTEQGFTALIETALAEGVSGMIIANTTVIRPRSLRSRHAAERGGLSGPPLFARALAMLAEAHRIAGERLVLIGCGGIGSGAQVLDFVLAGAHLVQLYTAFIYEGPPLIPRLRRELAEALRNRGFRHLAEARGRDAAQLAERLWNI
jgi:dihydroorotate dehydrogenase